MIKVKAVFLATALTVCSNTVASSEPVEKQNDNFRWFCEKASSFYWTFTIGGVVVYGIAGAVERNVEYGAILRTVFFGFGHSYVFSKLAQGECL